MRRAYTAIAGDDLLFTAALYQFFERMQTYRYLFTRQMRALQARLAGLARQECYPQFVAGWRLVSALQVVPGLDQVLRVVRVQEEFLVLTITLGHPRRVPLRGTGALWYTPVIWQLQGALATQVLGACRDGRMFFAANEVGTEPGLNIGDRCDLHDPISSPHDIEFVALLRANRQNMDLLAEVARRAGSQR